MAVLEQEGLVRLVASAEIDMEKNAEIVRALGVPWAHHSNPYDAAGLTHFDLAAFDKCN